MSFARFISQRIYADKDTEGRRFSRPAIRIAMVGVAVGVAVMLVSLAVVLGFKREVSSKVAGFGSHVQVLSLTQTPDFETLPLLAGDSLMEVVRQVEGVAHAQRFSNTLGILKTREDFCGLTFKGVGEDYDLSFIGSCMVDGRVPSFSAAEASDSILLSRKVAADLGVRTGDRIFAYFMSEGAMRARRFTVAGLFATNMNEYDTNYAITDIRTVRKLKGWEDNMVSGLEIAAADMDGLDSLVSRLDFVRAELTIPGATCGVFSIKELAAHTFAWLSVLDMNVVMILILMTLVSAFTIVGGLLIIMLERISMIGTLRVLGATCTAVRRVFIHFALALVGKGMFWGNVAGLLLCFAQWRFRPLSLDASVYYIDAVPVVFHWPLILAVNAMTLLVSAVVIWGGSHLISVSRPAQTTRYE